MIETAAAVKIRPADELDLGAITRLDERLGGRYRPEVWERRMGYYLRRDPEASVVAEIDGRVVGFMLGEVRSGEFGLEEPTGWIEVLGVDPDCRGQAVGRRLAEAMLAHFGRQGAKTVRTLVDEGRQDLCGFFSSLGFEPAPLRPFLKRL
jgi:ribosomal protein S18 acetylase RimI-like enzyme